MTRVRGSSIICTQVYEEKTRSINTPSASKTGLKGRGVPLAEVKISERESFEAALRRFNRKIQQEGILAEFRRRQHYETPGVRRKKKEAAKRRKIARKG